MLNIFAHERVIFMTERLIIFFNITENIYSLRRVLKHSYESDEGNQERTE